ncbi:MAG: VWA domain-containing protein [Crocinitomicaceae bacterium]|nr:VWA domain-containing protein [Crocinitomicaceae bacterium]
MKRNIITIALALLINTAIANPIDRSAYSIDYTKKHLVSAPVPVKIQIAILFDTSNSMDGLIDQAKSRIWKIVNEMTGLTYNGQTPDIEFALYDYGNQSLSRSANFIRQQTPFTTDLDFLSQKLFALRTNGGDEYCGAVIERSIMDLGWSFNNNDLKMIYIAGNEPFNQGPVDYKSVCEIATSKNIFVNTIYCGDYNQGVKEFWRDGASCSGGDYFNINSDNKVVHIPSPYDNEIRSYNDSLNSTYVSYGSKGIQRMQIQLEEDGNAAGQAGAVAVERSIVKSKKSYNNSTWDMVDAVEEEGVEMLDELK